MDSGQSDPQSRGHQILIVQLAFLSIAAFCALVRAHVKVFVVKNILFDDYLIFSAMVGYTVHAGINIDGIINGATGKPAGQIGSLEQEARSLRAWYLAEVLYPPITLAIRGSLCTFLLRLAFDKSHIRIIWVNFCVLAVVSFAFFFILTFQCNPPSYFWQKIYGKEGYCLDDKVIGFSVISHAVCSTLSDWCLGLLPVLILRRVNLNKRTKAVIALLLSLGITAGMVLIIRLTYIHGLEPGPDFLYKSTDIGIWSVMEPAIGITAACIPTFRPLFKTWGFGWNLPELSFTGQGSVVNRINRYSNRFSYQSRASKRGSTGTYDPVMREVHHRSPVIDEESMLESSERDSKTISIDVAPPKQNSHRSSMPPAIPYPPGYRASSRFD